MSLAVVVPTRDRPHAVGDLVRAFASTITDPGTTMILAVETDDPNMGAYQVAVAATRHPRVSVEGVAGGTMVSALNAVATRLATDPRVSAIGFLGDDHRPRTRGWDTTYLQTLRDMRVGIVYGDDLVWHDTIPTHCVMSADIVRALGWMAYPGFHHLYVDDFWRDLGNHAGCLRYLPDVVVEHLHPSAGTAEWDPGYRRVNDPAMYDTDKRVFESCYETGVIAEAAAKIIKLREDTADV